jgi:SHS2 domain-containing protein
MADSRIEQHVGEWTLTIIADSLEDLFVESSRIVGRECGPTEGEPSEWERVSITARDVASLLVDWINELIARSEIHARAYTDVRDVAIRERGHHAAIDAEVRGLGVRAWRSPLKAATHHALELDRTSDHVRARVLIDVQHHDGWRTWQRTAP